MVDIKNKFSNFWKKLFIRIICSNHKQLFVPRGFAHGFIVLSETATFFYKCDNFYNKESEGGFIYNDATLNIRLAITYIRYHTYQKRIKFMPSFEEIKHTV